MCEITGVPFPTIRWYKNGKELVASSKAKVRSRAIFVIEGIHTPEFFGLSFPYISTFCLLEFNIFAGRRIGQTHINPGNTIGFRRIRLRGKQRGRHKC